MRMSYLIEACETQFEDIAYARETRRRDAIQKALQKANADPNVRCPYGYHRKKGRCVKGKAMEPEDFVRFDRAKYVAAKKEREGGKKPSLVDRMKSLFGKK